jgi:hypothetical protein
MGRMEREGVLGREERRAAELARIPVERAAVAVGDSEERREDPVTRRVHEIRQGERGQIGAGRIARIAGRRREERRGDVRIHRNPPKVRTRRQERKSGGDGE